jgi:hypothetical protein
MTEGESHSEGGGRSYISPVIGTGRESVRRRWRIHAVLVKVPFLRLDNQ